jgi:prophage regulatory protein
VSRHLVGVAELAEMLAVSKQRTIQIVRAYPDFPAPVVDLASGRVWRRADVEKWIRKHPVRRPGRPTAEA